MSFDRRAFLASGLAVAASATASAQGRKPAPDALPSTRGLNAAEFGLYPGSDADQSGSLQRAIDAAASTRVPLALAPGTYRAAGLNLPAAAHIVAARGSVRIRAAVAQPILIARAADGVTLDGLVFDGGGHKLPENTGLIMLANGKRVRLRDCEIIDAGGDGLRIEGIGGEVSAIAVLGAADTAILSIDARGLTLRGNEVRDAGKNGIQIVRSTPGDDGTLVVDNRIADIRNRAGGSGQYGNGINAFRAGNVIVRGNVIAACAFSAVRGNSSSNIHIEGNSASDIGDIAYYVDFAFAGAVIANNMVARAQGGVSVTNFNNGGHLAVVHGNVLRDIVPRGAAPPPEENYCNGIHVEADTAVTGNVIERADAVGILAGWGDYLRDVAITGNVVREASIGIGVSATRGAGAATVSANVISKARRGAIFGMDHLRPITKDLTAAEAQAPANMTLSGNRAG